MEDLEKKEVIEETETKENDSEETKDVEVLEGEVVGEENKEEAPQEEEEMETIIECYTDYNYKARKTCQMYFLNVKSRFKLYNIIMVIVCMGIYIYSLFIKNYIISVIAILSVAYLLYSFITQEKKVDKAIINFMKQNPSFRMNYYINDEKIKMTQVIDGKEETGNIPWAYVQEVHYTDEYYFLYLQGATLIIDRNEECITKGDKETLDELIKKACELKPLKYYNKPLNIKFVYDDSQDVINQDVTNTETESHEETNEEENNEDKKESNE